MRQTDILQNLDFAGETGGTRAVWEEETFGPVWMQELGMIGAVEMGLKKAWVRSRLPACRERYFLCPPTSFLPSPLVSNTTGSS
ncbi:hypothetical protein EV1_003056 [Malus domestica]